MARRRAPVVAAVEERSRGGRGKLAGTRGLRGEPRARSRLWRHVPASSTRWWSSSELLRYDIGYQREQKTGSMVLFFSLRVSVAVIQSARGPVDQNVAAGVTLVT